MAAEAQLTADGFGLYGNTAKQWQEMFLIDNAFCKEAIVVQLLSSANTGAAVNSGWEASLRFISQGGKGGMEAPKEMIDLFPMANGSRPTAANNYNEFLFFKNRDPRFYRTFAFSGSYWPYTTSSSTTTVQPTVWAYRWVDNSNKAYFSDANNNEKSPAFVRKMSNPTANSASSFQYSGTDIFEYRYAELLLNIAECYAAKGDIPNTLAYLGKIRNRVGIPSANNYGIGTLTDKYAAIEACLYERRVELAYEGKRYWDVQRWMLYSDDSSINQDNTNVKLGIPTINGTQRTGNFLQYKIKTASSADPLASARAGISVNPDASDFQTQIAALEAFYTNNFVIEKLPDAEALDVVSAKPAKIDFKPNYYIMGLKQDVLALNPWIIQTLGWNGASASGGTFIYQE
ncbi:RagB/SusD family nutrient uptake outer membrane protein [Flavobacterium gyeonganense]|uniref:RagB/SusD family nutrient uptake outer membrane protein n=1 Tax=Flavobacterium gyeonganense TaxID=1310418 RepID=UPI002413ECCC|nr:RagB/SusD family nutrient uptake outer membrane protein [Flavobacterium gyeonganense]